MVVVPEMIGSVVGIYNGKVFNQIEVKVCLYLKLYTYYSGDVNVMFLHRPVW